MSEKSKKSNMTIVRNRDTALITVGRVTSCSSVMVSYEFWEVCVTCSGHISLRRRTDTSNEKDIG